MNLYSWFPFTLTITPVFAPFSLLCTARSELQPAWSRGCSCFGSGHRRLCVSNRGTLKSSPSTCARIHPCLYSHPQCPSLLCLPSLTSLMCAAQSSWQQARSRGCEGVGSGHRRLCVDNIGTLKSSPPQTPAQFVLPTCTSTQNSHPPCPSRLHLPLSLSCVQLDLSWNRLVSEGAAALAPAIAVCASVTEVR